MVSGPETRLRETGLVLPQAPKPFGDYVPAVEAGGLLFLSGMAPVENGQRLVGIIGGSLSTEEGSRAVRIATLNGIAVARQTLGSLDRIKAVVRLGISLRATDDFVGHAAVADAGSAILNQLFGPGHTRLIAGMNSAPVGLCAIVELIFQVG